jgi:hypothetical protein
MEGLIDCVYGWMEKRICESTSKQTAVSERVEKGKKATVWEWSVNQPRRSVIHHKNHLPFTSPLCLRIILYTVLA